MAEFSLRDGRKLWAGGSWVDMGQRKKQLIQAVMTHCGLSLLTGETCQSGSNRNFRATLEETTMFYLTYRVSLKNDHYSQFPGHWSKDHEDILSRNMIHFPVWKEIITIYKISNKALLQSTENCIQYLIKPIMEKNLEIYIHIIIYMYIYLRHFVYT